MNETVRTYGHGLLLLAMALGIAAAATPAWSLEERVTLCDGAGCDEADVRFEGAGSGFGFQSAMGDLNDDNFDDVVVGSPDEASVYVFYGSLETPTGQADVVLTGAAGSEFGFSVAIGPNGSLAIGAPAVQSGGAGAAYVIPPGAFDVGGVDCPGGAADECPIGNVDGVISFNGSSGDQMGYSVAVGPLVLVAGSGAPPAGDDVVVGARNATVGGDEGVGRIYVIPDGVSDLADATVREITGSAVNEGLGEFLALGDFITTGGTLEMAISAIGVDHDFCDDDPSVSCTSDADCSSVGGICNVNPGQVYVLAYPAADVSLDQDGTAGVACMQGEEDSDFFGFALAGGNYSANQGDELAVGAPYADRASPALTNSGTVYLYARADIPAAGTACEVASGATKRIDGRKNWDQLGFGVATTDMDPADGEQDLVMSARWHDRDLVLNEIDEGAVYVLTDAGDTFANWPSNVDCSANCASTNPAGVDAMLFGGDYDTSLFSSDEVGFALSSGDFNGDGFWDISASSLTHRKVYLVSLENTDNPASEDGQVEDDLRNVRDGDDDGDGYFDVDEDCNTDGVLDDPEESDPLLPNRDLGVTMTAIPDPANCDDPIEIRIVLTNASPELSIAETDLELDFTLPSDIFEFATGNGTINYPDTTADGSFDASIDFPLFFDLDSNVLAAGASIIVTFDIQAVDLPGLALPSEVLTATVEPVTNEVDDNHCSQTQAAAANTDNLDLALDCPDLAVTKIVDDETPDEQQEIIYTIAVNNNDGRADATNVTLTDMLPAGVTYASHTGDGTYASGSGVWTIGTIADNASVSLDIHATVDVGTGSDLITNTTSDLTLGQDELTADDKVGTVDITVNNEADLVVTKTVNVATPDEGDTITYTVTMTNNGPAQVSNASLDDVLPAGLTIGTVTPSGSTTWDGTTWDVGTLDKDGSATLLIQALVDAGASQLAQPITNTVTNVQLDQTDSNITPDDLSADITVNDDTDLVVAKTVDNATPNEDDTITYTVTMTNNGPAKVSGASLDDVLPAGMTIGTVTPSGSTTWNGTTWSVGDLNKNGSATLEIQATVDAGASSLTQPITNTVTNVLLDQTDTNATPDDLSEDITVSDDTDLVVTKTVDDATPNEDDTITYTVTMTNNGPAKVTSASLDDVLPAGLTIGTVTPSGSTTWDGTTWDVGDLNKNGSATLEIQATVDAGASSLTQPITNTVTNVLLDQTDTNATPDDLSEDITVSDDTDLVVTKTVDDATPNEGDTITYTVTMTNNGPAKVTSASLDDVLPAGLTIGTVTPSGSTTWDGTTWDVGDLNKNGSATLEIQADVDVGAAQLAQPITNTVTNVLLDQTDTNATPDDLSEDITAQVGLDLEITKTVDNSTPNETDAITFTVTMTNHGPAQVTGASLDDVLPAGLTIGTVTPSGSTTWDGTRWDVGTLNLNDSATLQIDATVDVGASALTQPITNTVSNVQLNETDTNLTPDDLSEDVNVNGSDFVVTKTVDNSTPNETDTITFTITATNNGPSAVTNASLDDVLPAGLTIGTVTPSGTTGWDGTTWTIGSLASGGGAETLTIDATVDVGASAQAQPITNAVTNVALDQLDTDATPDDLSEDVTVNGSDFAISNTVNDPNPTEGDTITFTITATNNGPSVVTNASLDDVLPAGLSLGAVTPSGGTGWNGTTWTIPSLASGGGTATLQIDATVDLGASALNPIVNTVTNVTLDQLDTNVTPDDLSEAITANPPPSPLVLEPTLSAVASDTVEWSPVIGASLYHLYRGDLDALRQTEGYYTQDPGATPNAGSFCFLTGTQQEDTFEPPAGMTVFYLVTTDNETAEGTLGYDGSSGVERPNDNPCR